MNRFDFDKLTTRLGTNCEKWDETEYDDLIPLWVADMDFEVAPPIRAALLERINHGIFGYTMVADSYYEAIINWFSRRHGWQINRKWIQYTTGVVPAVSAIIKALTMPGERVLIQTPVYNCFFSSIRNNGCEVAESALIPVIDETTPHLSLTYRVDWDDFERKCADPKTTVFLLCNPHNPAGRVWTCEEMERMNDICLRHGVCVISDEIHCELVMPGYRYTPFAAVSQACSDNSITCNSPSKSFNTAGLQMANVITSNAEWRRRINRAININEICDINPFGPIGVEAAYNHGEEWLTELNAYLYENYLALCTFFAEHLPDLKVFKLEGTYLVWVDITATGLSSDMLMKKLLHEGHVWVNSGTMYGKVAGEGYIRINIATQRTRLMEGLERMEKILRKNG